MNPTIQTERMSLARTFALIDSDLVRLADHLQVTDTLGQRLYFFLVPGFLVLSLHRVSRYAYLRGWRKTAR